MDPLQKSCLGMGFTADLDLNPKQRNTLFEQLQSTVWMIITLEEGDSDEYPRNIFTGVCMDKVGCIATALFGVKSAKFIKGRSYTENYFHELKIFKVKEDANLALLVPTHQKEYGHCKFYSDALYDLQEVYAICHPDGYIYSPLIGQVQHFVPSELGLTNWGNDEASDSDEVVTMVQINNLHVIFTGLGCPIFVASGELAGVVIKQTYTTCTAVHVSVVKALYEKGSFYGKSLGCYR